jgi:hypothetical protein
MRTIYRTLARIALALAIAAASLPFQIQYVAAQSTVTQWNIWERRLTTPQTHAWHDFPVQATFTHSSGRTLTVDGYYDGRDSNGRDVWIVRFAPTLAGTWSWSTASGDANLRASGSLQAVAPTADQIVANPNYRGHIRVATSGPRANRYFTYADGTPFFWLGDTVWDLNSLRAGLGSGSEFPNQSLSRWLYDRKLKGFTVALAQFLSLVNRNEGGYPFPGNTSTPGTNDFAQLNAEHFKALDLRMQALHDNGFVMAAHPAWLSEYKISLTNTQRLSRYLMARYGAYNLVWSLSGEYQQKYLPVNTWDDASSGGVWGICWDYSANAARTNCEWNQLGRAVVGYDAYDHPTSLHPGTRLGPWDTPPSEWGSNAANQSSSGEFHAQSWLDHNWVQSGQFTENLFYIYRRIADDYARTPTKPVVHSEGFYENEKEEGATPADIRWQAWVAWLNGSAGHIYGAGGVYQFYDPAAPFNSHIPHEQTPWNIALGYPGSSYLRHVRDFFSAVEWWKLEPSRTLVRVDGSVPVAPTASDLTPPHAASIANQVYVLFIPRNNAGRTIALTGLGTGQYIAQVFNPRYGTYFNLNNGNPVSMNGTWTVPASVYADSDDWVVKLTSGTTVPQPPLSGNFNVKINFQPAGSPVPDGMLADTGAVFGNRGNDQSYGWNADNSANARDREDSRSPDQRYDTFNHTQLGGTFTWELAVPNGTYTVRVVAGEATTYNSIFKFNLEGALVLEGVPTDHVRWIEGVAQVTVSDGRLTLNNAPGASLNKLAFIEVTGAGGGGSPTATPPPATATPIGATATPPPATLTATRTATPASSLPTPTPAPENSFNDDFNRPDAADPGPQWTRRRGEWSIASQALVNTLATEDITISYNSNLMADAVVSADLYLQPGGAGTMSLGLRWGNWNSYGAPTSGYTTDLTSAGNVLLVRNGDWVTLGSFALNGYTPGTRVRLTFRSIGSVLSVDVNGVTRITVIDSTHGAAGYAGIWSDDSTAAGQHRFDNFTLALASANTPVPATATATQTALPPTSTRTATQTVPPATTTATFTSIPPTATHTNAPPTATRTATQVASPTTPPTATRPATHTATPVATQTVSPTETVEPSTSTPAPSATGVPPASTSYEAEATGNTLNGVTHILYRDRASGGALVGWIGDGPDNWVQFNAVMAETSGEHMLTLHYFSAEPRTVYLSVNGAPGQRLDVAPLTDWQTVGTHELKVTLQAGPNTLRVYNDTAHAPGVDRIVVTGPGASPTSTPPAPTLTPAPSGTPAPTSTPGPGTSIKINFQKANVPVPEGYLPDTGKRFGDRGNGQQYGWNANNFTGRDRDSGNSPDQRYDTFIHLQKPNVCGGSCTWEIALPNGTYQVRVVAGDATAIDSVFRLNVEGVLVIDGTPTRSQRWLDNTATVTVSDGRLTLSNASGAQNNKVNFIEITPLP